jgi:hypothetical protein
MEKSPQRVIENDEQACYRAMRWSIKYGMKLTKSLEDINTKKPESCVASRFLCSGSNPRILTLRL